MAYQQFRRVVEARSCQRKKRARNKVLGVAPGTIAARFGFGGDKTLGWRPMCLGESVNN